MSDEPVFDTELLGLQHELIAYLGEAGFAYFSDVSAVEVDISNRELKIVINCTRRSIERSIRKFAGENGFTSVSFNERNGSFYLKR
jgi:hypothetical protein